MTRMWDEQYMVMRQKLDDGYGDDIVGKLGYLDERAEEHTWESTSSGVHLPALLRGAIEDRRHDWVKQGQVSTSNPLGHLFRWPHFWISSIATEKGSFPRITER